MQRASLRVNWGVAHGSRRSIGSMVCAPCASVVMSFELYAALIPAGLRQELESPGLDRLDPHAYIALARDEDDSAFGGLHQ